MVALAAALGLFASQLAWAQPSWAVSPAVVLEVFFSRANTVLRSVDPERGLDEPREAILALVNEVFDVQGAAALALGPMWQSRTLEQQKEFVRLFTGFLERGYIAMIGSKASVSDGVKIQYLGESVAGESATVATTLLTRNGSELPIDYSMVRRGDHWAVRDVIIDGVSLVANYRAQFNRILRTASWKDLLARMRTDAPDAPSPRSRRPRRARELCRRCPRPWLPRGAPACQTRSARCSCHRPPSRRHPFAGSSISRSVRATKRPRGKTKPRRGSRSLRDPPRPDPSPRNLIP